MADPVFYLERGMGLRTGDGDPQGQQRGKALARFELGSRVFDDTERENGSWGPMSRADIITARVVQAMALRGLGFVDMLEALNEQRQ